LIKRLIEPAIELRYGKVVTIDIRFRETFFS